MSRRRISNKRFHTDCMIGEFNFLTSKYSPHTKLNNLIACQSIVEKKPKADFNLSKNPWLLRAHDSSKQPIDKYTSNAQFINMLKGMRSHFLKDLKKPKGISRFSYLSKTVRRTPHDLQFLLCMAELLTSGKARINKDKKFVFVHNKKKSTSKKK